MIRHWMMIAGMLALASITHTAMAQPVAPPRGQSATPVQSAPQVVTDTRPQNPITWTVIEYASDQNARVNLKSTAVRSQARGSATITRTKDQTVVNLSLNSLTGNWASLNVYAVSDSAEVSNLGTVAVVNGNGSKVFNTPLTTFMLVVSPETNLVKITPSTKIVLLSEVPAGFEVVPGPLGVKIPWNVSNGQSVTRLLDFSSFANRTSTSKQLTVSKNSALSEANANIVPRRDGTVHIYTRLRSSATSKDYVLWALSSDNKVVKLGYSNSQRGEMEVQGEITLDKFGLFITAEQHASSVATPEGELVAATDTDIGTVSATLIAEPAAVLSVKYCRYTDCADENSGNWSDTFTDASGPHDQPLPKPAKYKFLCTDPRVTPRQQDVECYISCQVKFTIRKP